MSDHSDDPLHPHRHDPNYEIPAGDGTMTLEMPDGIRQLIAVDHLYSFPYTEIPNCYIVSTGHGTSGPFTFGGILLIDLIETYVTSPLQWREVEVISADGFGNRLYHAELTDQEIRHSPLLAHHKNGVPLTRSDGLVRLIVPTERDDALRQVKWIEQIRVL